MANDDSLMSQEEIERIFSQTKDPAGHPLGPAKSPPPASLPARSGEPSPAPAGHHLPMAAGGKDDQPLAQDDIEKLLSETGGHHAPMVVVDPPAAAPAAATAAVASRPLNTAGTVAAPGDHDHGYTVPDKAPAAAGSQSRKPDIATQDIEYLLAQAEKALESVNSGGAGAPAQQGRGSGEVPPGVSSYRLNEFSPAAPSTEAATLDLIRDVELDLKIELGRTHMYLEDVLKLRKGSVVPLDKLAGDPVDIYVNGRLIARGEVLVLNDNFCVRVAELVAGANVYS